MRITRLISLAAQSFVAQIAADAHQCATRRVEMQAREKRERGYDPKDKRIVMTMEDVSAALGERGVDVRKPQYFEGSADEPEPGGVVRREPPRRRGGDWRSIASRLVSYSCVILHSSRASPTKTASRRAAPRPSRGGVWI